MNILIVDDAEENRYLLESLLKGNGHEVQSVSNGAEGLEKLKSEEIDLIISDILMPVMDGFQLCRKVKTDETLHHIPFIIYTATYTGPQDEAFAAKIGADRFIQKPCEPDFLMKAVNDVMSAVSRRDMAPMSAPAENAEVLKLYNERLVRKLEQKMQQAEREIEARKKAEETLRENEEKLRRITASAQDAIIMMDDQGQISFWNEAAERIFGYSQKEAIGSNLHTILAPRRFYDIFYENFSRFIKTGQSPYLNKIVELVARKKNGKEFPIELSLSGIEIRTKWHAIGIVRDITERKRFEAEQKAIEKKLQQTQQMEAIGTLAGGIAHDFNNLLSSILGFTELALEDVEKGSISERYLREVFAAGMRAKDLVKQILMVARQAEEEVRPVQISTIAKEVLKFIRSSIPANIEIKHNIKSNSLVMGNPTRIHQIFMNLCTNAAQAMEEKGSILEVSLKDVIIESTASELSFGLNPSEYVELTISDNGPGIPAGIIGSIFDPYFTTKGPGEGTGMGLAMVHGIVEKYGGKITVESGPTTGTLFTVHLPITKKRDQKDPQKTPALPSGTERILFIDDEVPIANIGSQILERLGYVVTTRTSSLDALRLFRSDVNGFDLVITDLNMPHMNGDQLAVELLKIRSDIPIILCTGYSKKINDQNALEMGIKAFAYKPIVKAELAKTVRRVLDNEKIAAGL